MFSIICVIGAFLFFLSSPFDVNVQLASFKICISFTYFFFFFTSVDQVCKLQHVFGTQRTAFVSWFSLAMWIPNMELRSPGLVVNTFIHQWATLATLFLKKALEHTWCIDIRIPILEWESLNIPIHKTKQTFTNAALFLFLPTRFPHPWTELVTKTGQR